MNSLLITGCSQVLTLRGPAPKRGALLSELHAISDAALWVRDGRIAAIGRQNRVQRLARPRGVPILDLGGRVVLPGFVDSHTHLVFPSSRAEEYEQRIQGKTYEQIARAGGGILSTVGKLRRASVISLQRKALEALRAFQAHGTTTVEAKSGYGLDVASELKILRLLRALSRLQAVEIVPTFLGAHIVPPEFGKRRSGAYIDLLVERLIPQVAREALAEYCDVYCDRGAFSVAEARRILTAGRACGLIPRLHAEQFAHSGGARLAVELGAASADHLEKINSSDIRALAQSNVVATLLPGCCFHLGLASYAPARKLIAAGAIVALATDFNPGTSPTCSMQMVLSLACTQMRMSPAEAIAAATINAAYSVGRHERIGSLEVGKYADLAVFDVADYREIPYYFGVNQCWLTMKRGKVIYCREQRSRAPSGAANS